MTIPIVVNDDSLAMSKLPKWITDNIENDRVLREDVDWKSALKIRKEWRLNGGGQYWTEYPRMDGRMEWLCPHGVGHGNHVHGCCEGRCCCRDDYPGKNLPRDE